jgi:hypothetical protein
LLDQGCSTREGGKERRTSNNIGKRLGGATEALRIPTLHDLDLDTENTLAEENVTNSLVNKVLDGL